METRKEIELCWVQGKYLDGAGNAYGYTVHSTMLYKYLQGRIKLNDSAPDALLIVAPEFYKSRIPDKVNWIFTMFEGTSLPDDYAANIKQADYLLAPSTWVRELLSKYFDKEKIFVIPHGVEPIFTYKKRYFPQTGKFRFLWVGAPNPRKGYEEVIAAWKSGGFLNNPKMELYIKTTRTGKLESKGNVVLDGRNLPISELISLYHKSYCFLFPSRGEGFGLTLAEAMATGLPCIGTSYSGHADFFDENVGYTIRYKFGLGKILKGDGVERLTECAYPFVNDLVQQMVYVYTHYKEALRKAYRGSLRIRTKFTWDKSVFALIECLERFGGGRDHA